MNEDRVAPPAGWGTFMSPYWFLKEDGFLQHHGLGLTEAVSGALRGLDAKLHCSLRRSATLWRQEGRRRLLGGALHTAGSVVHKHKRANKKQTNIFVTAEFGDIQKVISRVWCSVR